MNFTQLYAALRSEGMTHLGDANWVILENNGQFSIIPKTDMAIDDAELLSNVERIMENT